MYTEQAEVKVKDSTGKVVASQPFTKQVFHGAAVDKDGKPVLDGQTPEQLVSQAVSFFQALEPTVNPFISLLSRVSYAYDLEQRWKIRQGLVAGLEGPEKAIEKAAQDFMKARAAAGKPITIDAARVKVAALMAE